MDLKYMAVHNHNYIPSCRVCCGAIDPEQLVLGHQSLCNRFLANPDEYEHTHPLHVGVCSTCSLIQLIEPVPVHEIAPRFPWIKYNEPEDHLDHLTKLVLKMTRTRQSRVVAGVSYKDDSTLERFRTGGVDAVWRISPEELDVVGSKIEIETVQDRITPLRATAIAEQHAEVDVLIVRHILEHTHDISSFLTALKILVKPDALLVFEVPDSSHFLALKDYSTIWEEHTFYFTPATLGGCLVSQGFEIIHTENYPYSLENSLVMVVRPCVSPSQPLVSVNGRELEQAQDYFAAFPLERDHYRQLLSEYRQNKGEIALLGAGHLACMFLNLMGLREYVTCVLDDDCNRQGLFMPGSGLPIKPSAVLNDGEISLCLLSLNPSNEEKVILRQRNFVEHGGEFKSIFPVSRHALRS
jgi:hypothetical protein